MEPKTQSTKKVEEKLSLPRFALAVGVTVLAYILMLKMVFPTHWVHQMEAGLWPIVWTSVTFHFFLGGFEFFFHRYILHELLLCWLIRKWKRLLKWFWWLFEKFEWLLKKFEHDHRIHHALTPIFKKKPFPKNSGAPTVTSRYAITEEGQYESSFFPYWGLAGFTFFFSPIVALLQWLMPHTPIILGSFVAMTFSYCLYEMLHAVEHVPYESFWKNFVESPRLGKIGKKIWGFHAAHHANVMCNMAISGFFGLPVFDWIFRTYKHPRGLLVNGAVANESDFQAPVPCRFIRWLDGLAIKLKAA